MAMFFLWSAAIFVRRFCFSGFLLPVAALRNRETKAAK
jgi:hypothetical protein